MTESRFNYSNADIVIVDDTLPNLQVLSDMLSEWGHGVRGAPNGPTALMMIHARPPDLILLDIQMPGMNGYEVCQRLKADEMTMGIPVIFISALDDVFDKVRGFEAGGVDYITKPFEMEEVLARVRTHLTLRRLQKQLEEQAVVLAETNAHLEQLLQLREDLAHMIVHDMRTPLTTIILYADLMKRMCTGKTLESLATVSSQAHYLNNMMDDMLAMARIEQDKLELNLAPVYINHLLSDVMESQRIIAEKKDLNLTIDQPEMVKPVMLDGNLFQRVLRNLVSNAIKFSPGGGTIKVCVEQANGKTNPSTQIQVFDEGPGIPEEHHETIFEKYGIVKAKKSGISQVGLGLAFCKMVVESHGGRIFVKANKPAGSIFTIEI
jgi:signal transduction histidine kinase